jgi:hypothetical protein
MVPEIKIVPLRPITPSRSNARDQAQSFGAQNEVTSQALVRHRNDANESTGDIVLGRLYNHGNLDESMDLAPPVVNSVRAVVRMTDNHTNGSLPLFFAPALGTDVANLQATATATVWYPALLPFATSVENWETLDSGGIGDNFGRTPRGVTFGISAEGDGNPEIVMFPGNGTDPLTCRQETLA